MKVLRETERGAIFRLGRFNRLVGPGRVFVVPFVDRLCIVDLDRTIPEWREVPVDELDRMVEFLIRHYPEIPAQLSLDEIRETMRSESK